MSNADIVGAKEQINKEICIGIYFLKKIRALLTDEYLVQTLIANAD